jgi:NTP pyrophosphatase (non-canonical NTP hydrolase)
MDKLTTLGELRAAVAGFVAARNWQPYHTPKNLAMSIAIEAAELMEHFQWLTAEQAEQVASSAEERSMVADELADVLIYCLSFADSINIDISQAVGAKLKRNEVRFPVAATGYPPGDPA